MDGGGEWKKEERRRERVEGEGRGGRGNREGGRGGKRAPKTDSNCHSSDQTGCLLHIRRELNY